MTPFIPESSKDRHRLRRACRLWRIQTGYNDMDGAWKDAPDETLLLLLNAVCGRSVENTQDLDDIVHETHAMRVKAVMSPVHVIWQPGSEHRIPLVLPQSFIGQPLSYRIEVENGPSLSFESPRLESEGELILDRETFHRVFVTLPRHLPIGYHQLTVKTGGREFSSLLMCAPRQVGDTSSLRGRKSWGVFAPLYAIRSERDWGIGDLRDLETAQSFVRQQGGDFFGTLPLLPSSGEENEYDPSPYSPVSRLFWNEIHLDVEALVEESGSERAQRRMNERGFRAELARLRSETLVDGAGVLRVKKEMLQILSEEFFSSEGHLNRDYLSFLEATPEAPDYARFRSRGSRRVELYHLFVQFKMDQRLKEMHRKAQSGQIAGLYLDFPVGVSRNGYDSERFKDSFLLDAEAGAPPDLFFSGGQKWGFAPLHPIRIREQKYEYMIKAIRHHMKYASALRIDHIMAFHRIYAVPNGKGAKEGSYLRFCPDEFFALLSIEAHRAGVRVVGEDLGTVPKAVRRDLLEHDCLRMWVLPFEAKHNPPEAVKTVPERSLACMNTHDMAPFAGYWACRDLELFDELGVLEHAQDEKMKHDRQAAFREWQKRMGISAPEPTMGSDAIPRSVYLEALRLLAESPAELLLVNIEDTWGETEPQNIPGTWKEYANWRRKLKVPLQEWGRRSEILEALVTASKGRLAKKGEKSERAAANERSTESTNEPDSRGPSSFQ